MMKRVRFCIVLAAAMSIVLAAAGRSAAEPPELHKRYFALIVPRSALPDDFDPEQDFLDLCPDLEGDAAKLLVALPGEPFSQHQAWHFMSSSARLSGEPATTTYECGGSTYEKGEVWIGRQDVTFASAGGNQTLSLVWKDELPPPGAVAFAGPLSEGGQARFFDWFAVRPAEGYDTADPICEPYWFRYMAYKPFGARSFLWCIGVGYFSK